MTKRFEFDRILDGTKYSEVLWYIEEYGNVYVSERGQEYYEAEPVEIVVTSPFVGKPEDVLPPYIIQRCGPSFIIQYATRLVDGRPEPGWSYSYIQRWSIETSN